MHEPDAPLDIPDDACVIGVDEQWVVYPEHDFNETECTRCGAEPED